MIVWVLTDFARHNAELFIILSLKVAIKLSPHIWSCSMSTLNELAEQISLIYPIEDQLQGIRYRIVDQLGGTTELEAIDGESRYVATRTLNDQSLWRLSA